MKFMEHFNVSFLINIVFYKSTAIVTTILTIAITIKKKGRTAFTQRGKGTPAIANAPIRTACVGEIRFIVSEPAAQTITANSLPTPRNSPNEPIIGIVAVAKPDDDGIKKDRNIYTIYESAGNTSLLTPLIKISPK